MDVVKEDIKAVGVTVEKAEDKMEADDLLLEPLKGAAE